MSKRLLLGMPKAVFGGAKDCFWVGKTVLLRIRQKKDKKTVNHNLPLNVTASTGLTIITEIGTYQTKDTDTYTKKKNLYAYYIVKYNE